MANSFSFKDIVWEQNLSVKLYAIDRPNYPEPIEKALKTQTFRSTRVKVKGIKSDKISFQPFASQPGLLTLN